MAVIHEPISPVPGPSNLYRCPESVTPASEYSTEGIFDEQRETPVPFAAVATIPTIVLSSKPGQAKRKQYSTIATATPMKKGNKKKAKIKKTGKEEKQELKKQQSMKI